MRRSRLAPFLTYASQGMTDVNCWPLKPSPPAQYRSRIAPNRPSMNVLHCRIEPNRATVRWNWESGEDKSHALYVNYGCPGPCCRHGAHGRFGPDVAAH